MRGNEKYLELTPVKAIRAYCLECCDGQWTEVKRCTKDGESSALCPLYRYRLGHRPKNEQKPTASTGVFESDAESEETTPPQKENARAGF